MIIEGCIKLGMLFGPFVAIAVAGGIMTWLGLV